jgi:hypothetical protein
MTAKLTARRLLLLAYASLIVVAVVVGAASARSAAVLFVSGNARVVQGNDATMSINVSPSGARCSLAVRYKNGAKQKGLGTVVAAGGRASWTWTVQRKVKPGKATATASCAGAGRATKTFTVIGGVIPPKIRVVKSGWSVREYSRGSGVSYGVILVNESKTRDALDAKVLVNFVMPDNRLIGSATVRVGNIGAGTQQAVGGELQFPAAAPIARLEVVVEVGRGAPALGSRPPASFVRVMPSPFEPEYCGSVEGEVQNDHPSKTVRSVELSTVVLDANGNVIGGGHSFGAGSLPPAARMFFKITNGMRPLPMSNAASALVSVIPTYKNN